MSRESSQEVEEVEQPVINPYEVLGLETTATDDEIKKAYRKAALKNHPDKVPAEKKDEAHATFQRIAFAYAILSDPVRRKRYDETGSTEESVAADSDWSWTDFYRAQFADVITSDAIAKFAEKYKGSDEERADILRAYTDGEGDMDYIYSEVMLSNVLEDDERFREIIDAAIKEGEVEKFKAYSKEDKKSRKKRQKAARKEAEEAEQIAKELGVHDKLFGPAAADEEDEDDVPVGGPKTKAKRAKNSAGGKKKADPGAGLAALIQARHANAKASQDAFFDRLAEKYGAKEEKNQGKKSRKRAAAPMEEEPDEEAFQATARRLEEERKKKKRKVIEDNDEEEEVEMPRKKGRSIAAKGRGRKAKA